MQVAVEEEEKATDNAVGELIEEKEKLGLGIEQLRRLEQLGTDRNSTRSKQPL